MIWRWLPRKQESGGAAEAKDRRAAVRYPGSRVTSCVLIRLPEYTPISVTLRDLSTKGFGFNCRKPIDRGKFMAVDLQGANKHCRVFRVQVVHCTQQKDGTFLLGCIPAEELTDEDIELFV